MSGASTVTRLIDQEAIRHRVEELAEAIAGTITGELTIVVLLKGSFMFAADLVRALDRRGLAPRVEFMRLSSYGLGKESSGLVRLIGDHPEGVAGREVLLVDDIQDTGRTLSVAQNMLLGLGARRVWTCVLLDKPSRREVDFAADFVGFEIEDVFVVGYGIDFAEAYRHLPYIGTVDR